MVKDKGSWTTTVVVVVPTLVSIFAVFLVVMWLGFSSDKNHLLTDNYENCRPFEGTRYTCKVVYATYGHKNTCKCIDLVGVRVWRLVVMSLVICISAYATRSLYSNGGSSRENEAKPAPRRALAAAIAQCRRETGLEGEIMHHIPSGQQSKTVWERM